MNLPDNQGIFRVRRQWLFALSAVLWVLAAILLLRRAIAWAYPLDDIVVLIGMVVVTASALLFYRFWFREIVVGNIARIRALPSRPGVWHVMSWRGYGMVALMISVGFALRSSELPGAYLAAPYAWMAACLLIGAFQTTLTFLRETRREESS